MKVAYARVSSVGQNLEAQLKALNEAGAERVFTEKASAKGGNGRPVLEEMLQFVREGDEVIVTRLDRLARSVPDLRDIIQRLADKGVGFRSILQPIDTTRPEGRLFVTILGAIAEFELDLRAERQKEGIEAAKARGVYKGRKPSIAPEEVRKLLQSGKTPTEVAKELGIARSSVYRIAA